MTQKDQVFKVGSEGFEPSSRWVKPAVLAIDTTTPFKNPDRMLRFNRKVMRVSFCYVCFFVFVPEW